ncbi:TetR/AcrR family transcriptional regulator [Mycobacterium sp.]|uniref:TetR/AcrR family transcriptional regulator n=1 Tax=Mycobacterium sp. TaxID=1785 RepID=UPI003C75987A
MKAESPPAAKPPGGRPRDSRIDDAILRAAADLLLEVGYPNLTMGAIAERARTTRTALYRRWSTKADLVHEAVFPSTPAVIPPPATNVGEEVRAMIETSRDMFSSPTVRAALPGLLADAATDSHLGTRVLARFDGLITAVRARLCDGAERGELHPHAHIDRIIELIAGATIIRLLLTPETHLDDSWMNDISAIVIHGAVK